MTTAIYARRSTDAQAASLERQIAECERYAEAQGESIGETYTDSASGWKQGADRPGFDRMMADAAAGRFDTLLVWEASRLSRQEGDDSALAMVWRLRKLGVEVRSIVEVSTGNTLADDLNLLIKSHVAKEESDTKSKRVRSGKRRGMLEGIYQGAHPPWGYVRGEDRPHGRRMIHTYVPGPAKARVLRGIFSDYLAGRTPQQIADDLTSRGIEPPSADTPQAGRHRYARRAGNGQPLTPVWHQSSVRKLISSPLVAGFQTYKGVRVKACDCADTDRLVALDNIKAARGMNARRAAAAGWDDCEHPWVRVTNIAPAIIDQATWEQAQNVLLHRAKPWASGRTADRDYLTHDFLLAGLLRCGHCGERVGARHDRHGRGDLALRRKVAVYLCRGRRIGGVDTCPLPRLRAPEVDEAVRHSFIEGFVDVDATLRRTSEVLRAQRDEQSATVTRDLKRVEADLAEARTFLTQLDADYAAGHLSADNHDRLYRGVTERIEGGEAAHARLTARLDAMAADPSVDAMLDKANSLARILRGDLEGSDKAALNQRLSEVMSEIRVTAESTSSGRHRVILDPVLRPEWMPDGTWTTLDFADDSTPDGVEVIDYLSPVLRQVDLWGDEATRAIYSS